MPISTSTSRTPSVWIWLFRWRGWACLLPRCPTSRSQTVRLPLPRSTGRWPGRCRYAPTATRTPRPRGCRTCMAATRKPLRPGDFVDPGAQERKAVLLSEAERELDEFIGLEKVKDQVARLKSAVAMELVRKERGLEVAQRTHHLVFTGPPGTGKTTIARVVAKIYCGLGLLKKENIKEVHRADLIGQHIGETEAKTNAMIDSALDGVLFLDEAYALVATGAKNDFGLVAIDTLLARMENDRDRLVVIIAGYRADLDRFLDTNQGLRSRFTRTIDFPSYQPAELIEIANFMATRRDSTFEQAALDDLEALFAHLASTTKADSAGVERRGLDIAGNGRFVRNVVEKSEEEREFRLDHSEHAQTGEFTDEELMTITAADLANTVPPLLEGLRLETPA